MVDSNIIEQQIYDTQSLNLIPISLQLINHVKRIDGFNDDDICKLKQILLGIAQQELEIHTTENTSFEPEVEQYLSITLKINQIFSLLDLKWEDQESQLQDALLELTKHDGLNYLPRERTSQGRIFEHASDSRILIKIILQNDKFPIQKIAQEERILFYIKLQNDQIANQNQVQNENLTENEIVSKKEQQIIMNINKSFVELALKSNGKADLYFQSYIWYNYLQSLFFKENQTLTQPDFEKQIVQPRVQVGRIKGLSESLQKVAANISKFLFNKENYLRFIQEFGGRKQGNKIKLIEELQRSLFVAQISDDKDSLYWIEKILIQLLGYYDLAVRDQAVVLLNMLYDGVDWQLQKAFSPVVRCIGQHFKINLIIDYEMNKKQDPQLFLGVSAPYPIEGFNQQILTWHKIDKRNIVKSQGCVTEISINFGKFWKCGFYDWRIIEIKDNGRFVPVEVLEVPQSTLSVLTNSKPNEIQNEDEEERGPPIAQGRFIVQAKGMKDQIFHEVCVDFQDANIDSQQGKFVTRGSFKSVEQSIPLYKKKGITSLYLMGTLERDNYPVMNSKNQVEYKKPEASFLAITSRDTPNIMLGGDKAFQRVMYTAKEYKLKIIIDCLSRISSSRHHRKYKDLLLYYLDEDGKRKICYGTDGQSINYEDSALLNYRKIEAWNLLIQETLTLVDKYGIDGIHLDNGQAWPQIMETDLEELMRLDVDGESAYSPMDLMNGEIVLRNEKYGYWNTEMMETYPNPLFIKLCKSLWEKLPNFIIIGECWGGYKFEHRQIIMARSGVIPRMYKLPQAICSLFGKKLMKNGEIQKSEKENVTILKEWYESDRRLLPEGTILLQSSSAHSWPYPAYLYGKATWAAVDILYFMPDIPITFMGEIDGEVYRIDTTQVFQHEQTDVKLQINSQESGQLKRSNSQIKMSLEKDEDDLFDKKGEESKALLNKLKEESKNGSMTFEIEKKRGLTRVRSGSNLAAVLIESKPGTDIKQKEEKFQSEIGPLQGFDLKKINTHYEHRRKLRREKMVLRYGSLIPLVARHSQGWHTHVLAYARYSLMETAIIATNLTPNVVHFWIDLKDISKIYTQTHSDSTVVMLQNWLSVEGQIEQKPEYYFLQEFLNMKTIQTLDPYRSSVYSIAVCQDGSYVLKKALQQSIERTKSRLSKRENIESEQISLLITDIVERQYEDVTKFANVIGSLQESFMDALGLNFYQLIINNHKIKNTPLISSRIIALCQKIVGQSEGLELAPKQAAESILLNNKFGPIVFCTPELGRWSTVGGLGVMVDELAYGLAQLGQDVWIISPYYERNRKGETGYLERDPAGIYYKYNITASIEGGYVLGVHQGVVNNVKVVFLHQRDIFPSPYPDSNANQTMRQIAVFGKGCLEFCCAEKIIPSVCVTNDWFTALVPAYAKVGAFGDTFSGTTFFHIVHNLEPTYEGRLFPAPQDGYLERVHGLPRDYFVDPYWQRFCVNPSRCAILKSDQWGTVSPSYKQDLLNTSALNGVLKEKPYPFAFPNGIPIKERIKKMDACAPDHLSAKQMIQQKYFNYQALDDSVPLFAFVGRITLQKGVHLILDSAEGLIHKANGKINILVGGAANMKEPYSAQCAHKMWNLRNRFPNCFWADPNQFFTDGSLVNRGSDFGLMPSIFEPGGIVQHEFFVGGTPVIAFKTGGLKDSVFEFIWDSNEGNGYCFESHSPQDYLFACERALGTFKNKEKYGKLRENAFLATMDGDKVSKAWLTEFCRLRDKVFVDSKIIEETSSKLKAWSPSQYSPILSLEELFGINQKLDLSKCEDIDHGAEEEKEPETIDKSQKKIVSLFEHPYMVDEIIGTSEKFPHIFMMHNQSNRHQQVQLCGSFDNWQVRHNMSFDQFSSQWYITLHLKKGKYTYKYVINGNQWVYNEKELVEKDSANNFNNYIIL